MRLLFFASAGKPSYSNRPFIRTSSCQRAVLPLANRLSISRPSPRINRSASAPGATQPFRPVLPITSAGVEVSSFRASSSGRPRRTRLWMVLCRYLGDA